MQLRKTTLGAVTALVLMPAAALAANIDGGPGNERLVGTNAADRIDGNAGNDRLFGRGAPDVLIGGRGNDRVFGGQGDDKSSGQNGRDLMSGGDGDDTQDGGAGNDVIFANLGTDVSNGGDGNDLLWALARRDVTPGPNGEVDQIGDTLSGGNGNDRFRTRDGEVDRVTCGEGTDRAALDQVDVITDATAGNPNGSCETVQRKAPKARDSKSEDRSQSDARREERKTS